MKKQVALPKYCKLLYNQVLRLQNHFRDYHIESELIVNFIYFI